MARPQLGTAASRDADAATLADLGRLVANVQTAAYTLVLTDKGKVVEANSASAVTVTVPVSTSVAFPIGTVIEVLQYGSGQVTIAGASGVTLRNPSSLTTRVQFSAISLRMRAVDEWVVGGDLT